MVKQLYIYGVVFFFLGNRIKQINHVIILPHRKRTTERITKLLPRVRQCWPSKKNQNKMMKSLAVRTMKVFPKRYVRKGGISTLYLASPYIL